MSCSKRDNKELIDESNWNNSVTKHTTDQNQEREERDKALIKHIQLKFKTL